MSLELPPPPSTFCKKWYLGALNIESETFFDLIPHFQYAFNVNAVQVAGKSQTSEVNA